MEKQSYISKYENNKEIFEQFFRQEAKLYWKIWKLHNVSNVSYDKIAYQYKYVKSNVKYINDRVEKFLDNPKVKSQTEEHTVEEMIGKIIYPNEFIGVVINILSGDAYLLFLTSIYYYQHNWELQIPRKLIMSISIQYKNIARRMELLKELTALQINVDGREKIKAFDKIEDNKGNIKFEFTEECLDYIDPMRHLLKWFISSKLY